MSYELLSLEIRKYIKEQGWTTLRPIQNAAISRILLTDENYILASKTASGKTEAAFLPILSKLNFWEEGVLVLYVSPLIALINDQFFRIEKLCERLDIPVTKWHGEANRTDKKNLVADPHGILMITPESLEAMFVNKPEIVKKLLFNLRYIVIDEIHSFIGTDRGIQLKSILSRLRGVSQNRFCIVGLSATIGSYDEAKAFTGEPERTKVLLDRSHNEIEATLRFFKEKGAELPLELIKCVYKDTIGKKVLIFPNTRGRVEEIAVKLKKLSERLNGHGNYFAHHSSIDKDTREYIEAFAKNSKRESFCIVCTSTMELGIDIGGVDQVIQIDTTSSISSLIQRVGRSGREEGKLSRLFIGATRDWSLIQAVACWQLYNAGFIEPPDVCMLPYDILVHQALSVVKSRSGIDIKELIAMLSSNAAFGRIEKTDIEEILFGFLSNGMLEKIRNEVIIGVDGEGIVNSRAFYSVFQSEEAFNVIHKGSRIGDLPLSPQLAVDANILLSARIWKITEIDFKTRKVFVVPAGDGKKPLFFGTGGVVHKRIFEEMMVILCGDGMYSILDNDSCDELKIVRSRFSVFSGSLTDNSRPVVVEDGKLSFYSFTGTKINRTLDVLFKATGINFVYHNDSSCFLIDGEYGEFQLKWKQLPAVLAGFDNMVLELIQKNPDCISFSKWGYLLPEKFQALLLKEKYFDIDGTLDFVQRVTLMSNKSC